jgi:hypothetical protein
MMRVFDYAEILNAKITPEEVSEWEKGTPEEWANESHRVATESVYKDIPADGDPPKIDEKYIERCAPVVDEQLEKAGVRLAEMLNKVFR